MIHTIFKMLRVAGVLVAAAAVTAPLSAQETYIQSKDGFTKGTLEAGKIARSRTIVAERYTPTIWIDPDDQHPVTHPIGY